MNTQLFAAKASQYARAQFQNVRSILLENSHNLLFKATNTDPVVTKSNPDVPDPMNLISNFEYLLVEFQSLLIWEKPYNSALALTMFTCFYWLVVLWSPRFFSIVAIMFFCYHFYEMWTKYVWPEIRVPTNVIKESWTSLNPKVLSAPEIEIYLAKIKSSVFNLLDELVELRRNSHGTFCSFSIAFFIILYLIGRNIPGVIIVYSLAMILFLAPGFVLYVVPSKLFDTIINSANNDGSNKQSDDISNINASSDNFNNESENISDTSSIDENSTSSRFSNQFYDNFFAKDHGHITKTDSTSDDSDGFEIISESEIGVVGMK